MRDTPPRTSAVDLLVEKHGKLRAAVEIKAKTRVAGADLSGLRSFAEAHPRVPLVVASLVPEEHRLGPVDVLPYERFLDRFVDWT